MPLSPLQRIWIGAVLALSSGCTLVSTGARSAIVVLVRKDVTTAGSAPLPMPPRDEIKAVLMQRTLWLADDKRGAQWIAYIDVGMPPTPLQPFSLSVVEVIKNPDWDPVAVSTPIASRDHEKLPVHALLEAGEARERAMQSSTR
jgi:hypothetical protein